MRTTSRGEAEVGGRTPCGPGRCTPRPGRRRGSAAGSGPAPRPATTDPAGSTWTVTSSGRDAISSTNRCRRAISNATRPTSQGRRGTVRGCSMRPTCRTKIRRAPSWTARPTGMLCTSPPSKKCSPSMRTGGSRPGTAAEASTAGMMRSTVEPVGARPARRWPRRTGTGRRAGRSVRSGRCCSSSRRSGRFVVQVGAGPGQRADPPEDRAAERGTDHIGAPDRLQPLGRAGRVGRDEHPVDGADRGAQHEVGPDAGVGQGGQHAHLVGAQHPATAEHEGGAQCSVRSDHTRAVREPIDAAAGQPR